jgi:hypothetical protein
MLSGALLLLKKKGGGFTQGYTSAKEFTAASFE